MVRAGSHHRGSARRGCRRPTTVRVGGAGGRGGAVATAATEGGVEGVVVGGGQHRFQLLLDFECWMSHCSVMSAHKETQGRFNL